MLSADYFLPLTGVLNYPKLPRIPGIESFRGHQFHTSRWDYNYTGGSQEAPDLIKLEDKRVGLVGTGPTSIQAFPQLVKWAKSVHLFQRTPASVDERNQAPTDVERWTQQCTEQGWQRRRMNNFASSVIQDRSTSEPDLINDRWTNMQSYKAIIGGPNQIDPRNPATIQAYIANLHKSDLPRQERLRARVDSIVKDKDIAERLKAWYPGWCKRPCFHDDYLPAFNAPNAFLVDTDGKGIERITETGIYVGNKQYELDVLIWGTGFAFGGGSGHSPGDRSQIKIKGRNGKPISQKWEENVATLHGVITKDFPNLFFALQQCGASANNTHIFSATCDHTVYMIRQAEANHKGERILIEPTFEAEEAWSMRIAANAAAFAAMRGCTPSYFTSEGRADAEAKDATMEQMMKNARRGVWGKGILDYQRITQAWRDDGRLEGLDISTVE